MSDVTASVLVHLVWNDDANEWEVIPADLQSYALDWAYENDGRPHASAVNPPPDGVFERADSHTVTPEDLAHMLGFAMVRATAPANKGVDWRPASPSLVGMLKDTLSIPDHGMSDEVIGTLIRRLLPIFSSVDENAHRRGMFDQRQAALTEGQS